jgi:nitronate monooxygenase
MWLADGRYVAAIVNAGGMGFITASTFPDPGRFREEVQMTKQLVGGKKFGVNFGISPRPGMLEKFAPHRQIVCEEGVAFVETSGSPPMPILPQLREAGIKVMHKAPAVKYGVSAEKLDGVGAICVIGAESGGHPGIFMIGTMVQAAEAPMKIRKPLVIGGGIGTGRQLAAILAMGGDAVLMGSRMTVSEEIWAHPDYKKRIVGGDGSESRIGMQIFKHHHRVLDNESVRAVIELERQGVTDFAQYEPHVRGEIVRDAYATGDLSRGMIDYGQSVAFANEVKPVEAIFDEIIDDAIAAMDRLGAVTVAAQ